jgi:hypothetical protein
MLSPLNHVSTLTLLSRFDGRALLEHIPSRSDPLALESRQDRDIANELDFERYRDLVEADRLEGTIITTG